MKDYFFNFKTIGSGGATSLPIIIKMFQYNLEFSYLDNNPWSIEKRIGSMGENNFEFAIDCRHEPLKENEETTAFQEIQNTLKTKITPTFRREDLISKFRIIEIPDLGNQPMSAFYRDFTVQIYLRNSSDINTGYKKVLQKYIGIIRHYTTGKAYILIDKVALNGENSNIDVIVRVVFKNNIENINNWSLEKVDEGSLDIDFSKNDNLRNLTYFRISNKDISYLLKSSDNYNLEIKYKNKTASKEEKIYVPISEALRYINYFGMDYTSSKEISTLIGRNTKKIDSNDNPVDGYFKQEYVFEYNDNEKKEYYQRGADANVDLTIGVDNNILNLSDTAEYKIEGINILTNQNLYNSIISDKDNDENIEALNTKGVSYSIFKDGLRQNDNIENITGEREYLPEFTNRLKFVMRVLKDLDTNGEKTINEILRTNLLYRGSIADYEYMVYSQDGHLVKVSRTSSDISNLSLKEGSIVILYDDGCDLPEPLDLLEDPSRTEYVIDDSEKRVAEGIFKFLISNPSLSKQLLKINSKTGLYSNNYVLATTVATTPAFVAYSKDYHHPDIIAFIKNNPVLLEKYIVNPITTYYRIPKDILINSDGSFNRSVVNSIEKTLMIIAPTQVIKQSILNSFYIYNTQVESDEKYDNIKDMNSTSLSNTNIINFFGRNEESLQKNIIDNSEMAINLFDDDGNNLGYLFVESGDNALENLVLEEVN